jgi:transposase
MYKQITHACNILAEHYSGKDHLFVFDNSPIHLARRPDAPSATNMPKFTPKAGSKNFLIEVTDKEGNRVSVPMTGGYFCNGEPQSFYWPEGDEQAGQFKGMAEILKERGWESAYSIRAECAKHSSARTDCCLRRILYNKPDFVNLVSMLERLVTSYRFGFLLLPKFSPELNPIEQCWGAAKREFRNLPQSTGSKQLEKFVKAALDSVSLDDIRK